MLQLIDAVNPAGPYIHINMYIYIYTYVYIYYMYIQYYHNSEYFGASIRSCRIYGINHMFGGFCLSPAF